MDITLMKSVRIYFITIPIFFIMSFLRHGGVRTAQTQRGDRIPAGIRCRRHGLALCRAIDGRVPGCDAWICLDPQHVSGGNGGRRIRRSTCVGGRLSRRDVS